MKIKQNYLAPSKIVLLITHISIFCWNQSITSFAHLQYKITQAPRLSWGSGNFRVARDSTCNKDKLVIIEVGALSLPRSDWAGGGEGDCPHVPMFPDASQQSVVYRLIPAFNVRRDAL